MVGGGGVAGRRLDPVLIHSQTDLDGFVSEVLLQVQTGSNRVTCRTTDPNFGLVLQFGP